MGVKNKERRRAKQAARLRQQRQRAEEWVGGAGPDGRYRYTGAGAGASVRSLLRALVRDAAHAGCDGGSQGEGMIAELVAGCREPGAAATLAEVLEHLLRDAAAAALAGGWGATDLWEVMRRRGGPVATALLLDVLPGAVEQTLAPRETVPSLADVARLGPARPMDPADRAWGECVRGGVLALGVLEHLYQLQDLRGLASPATLPTDPQRAALLTRVRALLAKAESTEFEEEADALTAKAAELMTRHRIDQAALEVDGPESPACVAARRCWLEEPYVPAKALLLSVVAGATRCRAVQSNYGFVTIVGELGDRFLPVLARQQDEVRDAVRKLFGELGSSRLSVGDGSGYAAGVVAADHADLSVAPQLFEAVV